MNKIYMIGNTHFDPVWLWKWDEAMSSITATFKAALDRMDEYADFIYSFACPPVFEWIKQTNPALFEAIKRRVEEGRWELHEGWWLQPDCFSPSGESLVRQGLYGQRYLKQIFGQYADTMFNIDSFGHPATLPQILTKSGICHYVFCRPKSEHLQLNAPFFNWVSPDGSRVKAYRDDQEPYIRDLVQTMEEASASADDAMLVYGVTDHGGAPTKKAIEQIQQRDNTVFSTVKGFFDTHTTDYDVEGEFITGDFGPYVNGAAVKAMNRKAEYTLLNAEKSCVIAGRPDRLKLTQCWQDVMFNQFHDILGGACIKAAYDDVFHLYGRAVSSADEILHYNLLSVTNRIAMPGKNGENVWNLAVWNLNAIGYDGYIEAEVQWVHEHPWYDKAICLEDSEGKTYECQIIRERSVIPQFRSRFLFKASIPPMGYQTFKVLQTGEDVVSHSIPDIDHVAIGRYTVHFDENGFIGSVYDHVGEKTVCQKLLHPVCFEDDGDTWAFNIDTHGKRLEPFCVKERKVVEAGAFRRILKVTYAFRNSFIEMYYRFYEQEDYMEVHYRVHWNEKHVILKLVTDVDDDKHRCAIPYGSMTRGANKREMPVGEWLETERLTFVSNSIFSYNLFDNSLGLNLLRSPIYGDFRLGEIDYDVDYDVMEQGITEGDLRVYFKKPAYPQNESLRFHNSPIVLCEANHAGTLKGTGSYFASPAEGVLIGTIKYAEDDDGIIVRGAEYQGASHHVALTYDHRTYDLDVSPYEIFTVKLTGDAIAPVSMLEE